MPAQKMMNQDDTVLQPGCECGGTAVLLMDVAFIRTAGITRGIKYTGLFKLNYTNPDAESPADIFRGAAF
ncbi:MAG: hypothetical protein KZQ58_13390 [gamma proteobacterium symbiont of Bathyaustriella thionipta]|nr:hypothetical protein [gamma proteobacterium symbiont of Bathyaustriella thionipta]